MRWFLLTVLALGLVCCKKREQSPPDTGSVDELFSLKELVSLELELDDESRESLATAPKEWAKGKLRINGGGAWKVNVRLKGNRSFRKMGEKASFKIKFRKKRRWRGLKTLTLNGMVEDPTTTREFLGYRLYREMGVAAPRVGYAELSVDGERYGLYALVESVDRRFLEDRFGNADGSLYEGEYGCDLWPDDVPGFDMDHGKDATHADLLALAQAVERGDAKLFADDGPLALDEFLSYLAVSAFISDFDGYRHSHNYRIYRDAASGKWHIIPWGIDRTFKKRLSIFDSSGLLASLCFAEESCRYRYLRKQEEVLKHFEKLGFAAGVSVVSVVTKDALLAGDKSGVKLATVLDRRKRLLRFIRERPAEIRKELTCLGPTGAVDPDGDGYACLDCDNGSADIHPGAEEICDGIDNDCSGLIDDSPSCACELVQLGGAEFELCNLAMRWHEAEAFCVAKGKHLARVDSPEQSKALIEKAVALRDKRWWIGLSDRKVEGTFQWADGSVFGSSNWGRNQPNNGTCNQDCVGLNQDGDGKWHDTHCGQPSPFICR